MDGDRLITLRSLLYAALAHVIVLAVIGINLLLIPSGGPNAEPLEEKAAIPVALDYSKAIKRKAAEAERKRIAEEQRLAAEAEAERQRVAEEQRLAAEAKRLAAEAEAERQRVAEEQRLAAEAEAERQRVAEEQRLAAEAEAERLRIAEEQRLAAEAEQKRLAEEALEELEQLARSALNQKIGLINRKVSNNWIEPVGMKAGLVAKFLVRFKPNGAVTKVELRQSSGDSIFDRNAEGAIYKASPLPVPLDPNYYEYYKEGILFSFSP